MALVVAATYRANPNEAGAIREILSTMAPLSREERGCLGYEVHQSVEEPHVFFIYEKYVDEESYLAHKNTAHFKENIVSNALSRLESREVSLYEPFE